MKAELDGRIVIALSMAEARKLRFAISSQALNPRGENDEPVVALWRALNELFEGKREQPEWKP